MQQAASLADSRTGFCGSMMGIPFRSFGLRNSLLRCSMYFHIFSVEFSHVFPILFPFLSNIAVAGDGDGIVSASDMEALAQALPKSTSATVATAGHVPMLEARPKLDSIRRCMALLLLDSSHR